LNFEKLRNSACITLFYKLDQKSIFSHIDSNRSDDKKSTTNNNKKSQR